MYSDALRLAPAGMQMICFGVGAILVSSTGASPAREHLLVLCVMSGPFLVFASVVMWALRHMYCHEKPNARQMVLLLSCQLLLMLLQFSLLPHLPARH